MEDQILKSRANFAVIAFFFVGIFVLALGAGLFLFKNNQNNSGDIQIISASEAPAVSEIVVDVAGAVMSPGVYKLARESRVDDAIKAAGGLDDAADRARINLAAKVVDGQKVYVFAVGEIVISDKGKVISQVQGESVGLISINSGSQAELESLPGIGPVTAQKIIASRPYSALEDLKTKGAVGMATYEKIKELISL